MGPPSTTKKKSCRLVWLAPLPFPSQGIPSGSKERPDIRKIDAVLLRRTWNEGAAFCGRICKQV